MTSLSLTEQHVDINDSIMLGEFRIRCGNIQFDGTNAVLNENRTARSENGAIWSEDGTLYELNGNV